MGIKFDKVNRIIEVESPDTEVSIQTLIDSIRDYEEELYNMEIGTIATASGKEDLGGNLSVGITLKLLNWKLKFEDRSGPDYIVCNVTGGNLLAVDSNDVFVNPIEPASYVTVTKTSAVSAAIIGVDRSDIKSAVWDDPINTFTDNNSLGKKLIDRLKLKRKRP
jgi:hypothetical protein